MRTAPLLAALLLVFTLGCGAFLSDGAEQLEEIAQVVQSGDDEAAEPQLVAFTTEFPDNVMAWTILGNVRLNLDRPDEALEAFGQALALDPRAHQAWTGTGVAHRQKGELEKAIEAYEKALAIEPDYAQARSSVGVVYIKRKQYAEAVTHLEKARDLDREDPVIVANLAVGYHFLDRLEERDAMADEAERRGYGNMESLRGIFSGELTLDE